MRTLLRYAKNEAIHRVTVTQFRCQLAFVAILWVKLSQMFVTVTALKYAWLASCSDHADIFINQRIEYYLNITITLRPLTPHIMPCYTHKMAIVSWP